MAALSLCAVGFDYAAFALLRRSTDPAVPQRDKQQTKPGEDLTALSPPCNPDRAASALLYLRGFIVSCVGTGLIISTLGFVLQSRYGGVVRIGSAHMGIVTLNGIVIAGHYLIQSIGSPALGRYADAVGRVRAETTAFVAGAGALLPAMFLDAYGILVPLVLVFFVATVAAKLALTARAGVQGAASFARFMTAMDLGAAIGPIIGWLAISYVGNAAAVFAIGTFLYVVAAVASRLERKQDCSSAINL